MPGGIWNASLLPVRSGTYMDFIAAVSAAVSPGTTGSVAIIGTADWGPINTLQTVQNEGEASALFGAATWGGALYDATLQALDGFDDGGAQQVFAYRVVGAGAMNASVVLKDASAAPALTLTAFYPGVRANNWTVTVQTNASTPANCDILLYESGALIAEFLNIPGGTNTAAVASINAYNSPFVTAVATGTAGRALANIVGVTGGNGSFTAGNSGTTLTVASYAAAFTALSIFTFDAVALANVTDGPTQDSFAAWVASYNTTSGSRTFGVIGGAQGESNAIAVARSYSPGATTGDYNSCDMVNSTLDLVQLATGAVFSSAYLAPRLAGAISACGLARAATGVTWSGYNVSNPPSNAAYGTLVSSGVLCYRQDDATTISIEEGVTSQVTVDTNLNPAAHQRIANVAVDHFIANTVKLLGNAARGSLRNSGAGRNGFLGNVEGMLTALEVQSALDAGSTVAVDTRYDNSGNRMFIAVGLNYIEFTEQFLFTVAVGG
jgi:hypothetical protein